MNRSIRRKFMEAENQLATIKHWFKRTITLNRNWRESKREEKRLRGKKENNGALALRSNNQEIPGQIWTRPQVWPRRQEMPQQQVLTRPVPMEKVERTNAVIANPQQKAGSPQRNPYTMDVDRRKNRNCYACGEFGHLAGNCRNRRTGMNRRIEVDQDNKSNLNRKGGLENPN